MNAIIKKIDLLALFCIFILSTANLLFPQNHNLQFEHYSMAEGLPSHSVRVIYQDHLGFLWFGTHYGLAQYDGYTFQIIGKGDTSSQSISKQFITTIAEDLNQNLWIGTSENGIYKIDRHAGTIRNFSHNDQDSSSITNNRIRLLYFDQTDNLWIIYQEKYLDKMDIGTELVKKYRHDPGNPKTLSSDNVSQWDFPSLPITAICEDHLGRIWLGSPDAGLSRYDAIRDVFDRFSHNPDEPASLSANAVMYIYNDRENNIWVCTDGGGLELFDPVQQSFIHHRHDPQNDKSIPSDTCSYVIEDNHHNLWLALKHGFICPYNSDYNKNNKTEEPGASLASYNKASKEFVPFEYSKDDPYSKYPDYSLPFYVDSEDYVWSISHISGVIERIDSRSGKIVQIKADSRDPHGFRCYALASYLNDHFGMLWFGTMFSGINKLNLNTQFLQHWYHVPNDPHALENNRINCLTYSKLNPQKIWIGVSRGHGMQYLDLKDSKISTVDLGIQAGKRSRISGIPEMDISAIVEDEQNGLWISTYSDGLYYVQGNKIRNYAYSPGNQNSLSSRHTSSLFLDNQARLWVGTLSRGMNVLNTRNDSITYFLANQKPGSLSEGTIRCTIEDSNHDIWIATDGGLNLYSEDEKIFANYLSGVAISSICEDRQKNFWIGTYLIGLLLFDRRNGTTAVFNQEDGLVNNCIFGIEEDADGFLWLQTDGGLSKFDPVRKRFTNFTTAHGLPTNKFLGGHIKTNTGLLVLGTQDQGIIAFHPRDLKLNTTSPKLVFTDFILFNKSLVAGQDSPIKQTMELTEEIHLKHWQNDIAIETTALHYANPKSNRYRYWLENYDADWRDNGANRLATYTNLDPGQYIFHASGANSDGYWNEVPISLRIIIHSPWWATWWAYLFYGMAVLAVIYGGWRFQLRRIQLNHELERKVFEAKKLKEVDTMKSRFFANISHEFRTPITLIIGPLEKWIAKINDAEAQKDFSLIRGNVLRLQRLINQLLDLSRLEAGKMELHLSTEDLVMLVNHFVQSFESQAKLKEIQLRFESRESRLFAQVDREKMENILYNLISNALKFTPKNGVITVCVDPAAAINVPPKHESRIEIKVSDTGIGIPADRQDKIFDRFYRVDDSYVREHEGSGIGLALTKELVDLHRGDILVNSEPGVGSVFTVLLPVGDVDESAITTENKPLIQPEVTAEAALEASISASPRNHIKPLVLLVEDNTDLRIFISDILKPDYQTIEAGNGVEGLAQAQEHVPDLIISDVMMPRMDGYQLCTKLKTDEITSHIPIILLTARATRASKLKGLETGADDYLIKPFDSEELRVRVKNLIAQRRQLRARFSQKLLVEPHTIAVSSADERFLQRALALIEENLADPEFNAETFSRRMGASRSQLHRKLDALTGQSATEFIRSIRLRRAATLIKQGYGNISEIAFAVGFNHLSYFTECFRKEFGVNPRNYL